MALEEPSGGAAARVLASVVSLDDADYEYELALTRVAAGADRDFPTQVREALAGDTGADEAYALFYALNIYHRRMKEYSELADLVRQSGDRFRTRATYPHLQSLSYSATGRADQAFQCAAAAKDRAPRHAGILHNYALLVLNREAAKESPDTKMLEQAQAALDAAMAETRGTYARHHATYARLHVLREEYPAAEEAVDRAIDLEEPGVDYSIRIGEYEAIRLSGRISKSSRDISRQVLGALNQISETRRSIEERVGAARTETIQLLGLLAAVIAFIVGTTSIAAQLEDFDTSGRLLVLLTASILVIYSGFGAILDRATWKVGVMLALGLALGAFSILLWTAA
jgi:tetratricopeptide (TPR) repeat protein